MWANGNFHTTDVQVEPHKKQLHVTLAYNFPSSHLTSLQKLARGIEVKLSCDWLAVLFSRDIRFANHEAGLKDCSMIVRIILFFIPRLSLHISGLNNCWCKILAIFSPYFLTFFCLFPDSEGDVPVCSSEWRRAGAGTSGLYFHLSNGEHEHEWGMGVWNLSEHRAFWAASGKLY